MKGVNSLMIVALILINIVGFILTGMDKHRAKRKQWRISERTFFIIAILGGCPGTYLGLLCFRHKTKHWYFMIGIPLIFILQIFIIYFAKIISYPSLNFVK